MSFNFNNLERMLIQELENIYIALSKSENISAFALYTDTGGMTLCVSANTNEFLQKNLNDEPDEKCYYTWVPDEWKYSYIESKILDKLSNMLSSYALNDNRDFEQYLKQLIQVCINSLKIFKAKQLCSLEETIVLFTISDYDEGLEKLDWIKELNSNHIVKKYKECVEEL